MKLKPEYQYLADPKFGAPALVQEGLKILGTLEKPGTPNNPVILGWADEVGTKLKTPYAKWAADWYNADSIPWCGLAAAICAVRASDKPDRQPPKSYLSALAWADFGIAVQFKGKEGYRPQNIWVGDILVFTRNGGGHVGICVGVSVDGKFVYCLGGNQGDAVTIARFDIGRVYAVRRPPYTIAPKGARNVRLNAAGPVSTNEQ